jgi:hypothetical protein
LLPTIRRGSVSGMLHGLRTAAKEVDLSAPQEGPCLSGVQGARRVTFPRLREAAP